MWRSGGRLRELVLSFHSVNSGIEPGSSGLATNAFAALPSHQPITVIFHSHCTEENTKAKKWIGDVVGFRSGDRVARA